MGKGSELYYKKIHKRSDAQHQQPAAMHIKTTMNYYFILTKRARIKKPDNTSCGEIGNLMYC